VRERAVRIIAQKDPYAGLLIAMHTYSLLTAHADRSTIEAKGLALLDEFLARQRGYQLELLDSIEADESLSPPEKSRQMILEHFRLLQACDNLSLLTCVAFASPAHLLHPLPLNDGETAEVNVLPLAPRVFRLSPWPFAQPELHFDFPARHAAGKSFGSSAELEAAFHAAPIEQLVVRLVE